MYNKTVQSKLRGKRDLLLDKVHYHQQVHPAIKTQLRASLKISRYHKT